MALLVSRVPELRRFSLSPQASPQSALPARSLPSGHSLSVSNKVYLRNQSQKWASRRCYSQKVEPKSKPASPPNSIPSRTRPPPNMTTIPKAMQRVQNPTTPADVQGDIQIGPDGVVVPPKRAPSVAASQFVARKSVNTQQDVLKMMYDIDKKQQLAQKDKRTSSTETPIPSKRHRGSQYIAPEMVVFDYHPRRWVHTLNATACLASFPVHIWGFLTLPPHLVAPLFAGSLVWLWWHRRVMNTTLTKLVLQPGHNEAELTILNFFGMSWTRKVSVYALTSVLGRRDTPTEISQEQAASPLARSLATTEVLYLDVDELLVNATTAEEAFKLRSANDTPYRTRYVVQQPLAKTFRHENFLKFVGSPTEDPTTQAKNNLFE